MKRAVLFSGILAVLVIPAILILAMPTDETAHKADDAVAEAAYKLGRQLEKRSDFAAALDAYRQAAAHGHAAAQHRIGHFYHNGLGMPRDDAQAYAWYQKAAAGGNASGLYMLGIASEFGAPPYVEQSYANAIAYYEQSYAQGDADAALALGNLYRYGDEMPRFVAQQRGEPYDKPDIRDIAKARHWFSLAAAQGNRDAQEALHELPPPKTTP